MALYVRRRRAPPTINIVPLVDVLVVLIFFFLMAMRFQDAQSLDITPPKMDTAGAADASQRLVVGVDKSGQYHVNDATLTPEQLRKVLADTAAKQGTGLNVLIFADQDTPLKDVTYVMDESRKLHLDKIRLQAR
ncbi:MAG TPA: biopolymer transporter ExbD [Opitutales bacterium]|nr:biopolymer transporter ExbD [Opitutales bacterium]